MIHRTRTRHKIEADAVCLNIGQVLFQKGGPPIWTTLGSCVSVVFFSAAKKWSAICHAQLPNRKARKRPQSELRPGDFDRIVCDESEMIFVDCSVTHMAKLFRSEGVPFSGIEVSLIGGAHQHGWRTPASSVGAKNIETARACLKKLGLVLSREDVGGTAGRTVIFDPGDGALSVRLHSPHEPHPFPKDA